MVAELSWPVSPERIVNEFQYQRLAMGWANRVLGSLADTAVVYGNSTGLLVRVRPDKYANVLGHGWESGADEVTKAIGANTSGSTRYDLVVLGFDKTTTQVTCYVKAGTPGSGIPPALLRNVSSSGVFEVPLARVTVANNASTIAAGDVLNCAPTWANGMLAYTSITALTIAEPDAPVGMSAYVQDVAAIYTWTGSAWSLVSYAPGMLVARKTANQTVNSNTNLVDDNHLVVTVLPNAVYDMEALLLTSSTTAADLKVGWTVPSLATLDWNIGGPASNAADPTFAQYWGVNNASGTDIAGGVSSTIMVRPRGILVTSSNGGSFRLRIAQGMSNGIDLTVYANSILRLKRIG